MVDKLFLIKHKVKIFYISRCEQILNDLLIFINLNFIKSPSNRKVDTWFIFVEEHRRTLHCTTYTHSCFFAVRVQLTTDFSLL